MPILWLSSPIFSRNLCLKIKPYKQKVHWEMWSQEREIMDNAESEKEGTSIQRWTFLHITKDNWCWSPWRVLFYFLVFVVVVVVVGFRILKEKCFTKIFVGDESSNIFLGENDFNCPSLPPIAKSGFMCISFLIFWLHKDSLYSMDPLLWGIIKTLGHNRRLRIMILQSPLSGAHPSPEIVYGWEAEQRHL